MIGGVTVIAPLNEEQMEQMLANEFGGMDEIYADAYRMTKEKKYLDAAKRFSHKWLFNSMVVHVDNLDNKHANTQVPKVVATPGLRKLIKTNNMRMLPISFGTGWSIIVLYRWEPIVVGNISLRQMIVKVMWKTGKDRNHAI